MSNNIKEKLKEYKLTFGMLSSVPCTEDETTYYNQLLDNGGSLPENIHCIKYNCYDNNGLVPQVVRKYFKYLDSGLNENEVAEYLTYKKLTLLRTIKNCLVFFVVLTSILLGASLITSVVMLSML
ncbi:MAG: hypothetical protein Q4A12_05900 [Eubacteriales bacterium]|nr:hypothetical protein [Eubacteriales bacterium]